jgi:hypothetical protein
MAAMQDNPLLILLLFGMSAYVAHLWVDDYRRQRRTMLACAKALPGAWPAARWLVLAGIIGALLLVALETAGEYALGVSAEQSDITALFLLAMIAAGFVEELIFRGYLFVGSRGPRLLWLSIAGFSLLFALAHTHYYTVVAEGDPWYAFSLRLDRKAAWTLAILVANSLWFYALRFAPWNPRRSLIPCIAAHLASNLAVFAVKAAQGHVTAWW